MADLAGQLNGLNLGQDGIAQQPAPRKKKDRHAYHQIEQPVASMPPQGGVSHMQIPGQEQHMFQPGGTTNGAITPNPYNPAPSPSMPYQPGGQQYRGGTPLGTQQRTMSGDQTPVGVSMGNIGNAGPSGLSADQLPSVAHARFHAAKHYQSQVYPTMENWLTPQGGVPFIAVDQGNSSPKYARLTFNAIPPTAEMLASTSLPLGMVLQPLAPVADQEQQIPVLDFGDTGPPRCRRCRAYINPFMQFASGGNKFICNMCTHPNDVPMEYFAPTDPSGVRVDRDQRPELRLGTVEFLVPKEYWAKEPGPLRWLFLIDVSSESSARGFLPAICDGILRAIYGDDVNEQQDQDTAPATSHLYPGAKIGIATFNRDVHFYNLDPSLQQAQMMIMADIAEPFVPLSKGLFVDPYASRKSITALLKQIPEMFGRLAVPEPALLPALNAALSALAPMGGKILCSLSALPTYGPGALTVRDKGDTHDPEAEKKLFSTDAAEWIKTSSALVEASVGVDFFLESPSGGYLDIATIGRYVPATACAGLTYLRSLRCHVWWRDFLLPKLPIPARSFESV